MPIDCTSLDKSVAFVTMGCAKNEVDSSNMANLLVEAGYDLEDDPLAADVVIVNTCSFIQAATEESIDAILEAANYPRIAHGDARLIIAGCLPARYKADLEGEFPEASGFVSCAEERSIVARVDALFGIERLADEHRVVTRKLPLAETVSAYVKISDGCDRFCSYCTIPFIRGRYHSFPFEDIAAEVDRRTIEGAREIVLIAQDTGRWGADFDPPLTLADLVSRLAERYSGIWFRIMYIQPEGITDALIKAVASHDNICSYFDIPFQHASGEILSAMNRSGSKADHLALVDRIRSKIPDATLRTTLIAGFPGETDEQFEDTCDFISEACLDYVGVFPYSREEGTRAYQLPNQIDEDEKTARAQRLRDLADDVSSSVIAQRVGSIEQVLVCGREEDGQVFGRTMSQAPDVDGVTFVDRGEIGDMLVVRIDDTLLYEMEGTAL